MALQCWECDLNLTDNDLNKECLKKAPDNHTIPEQIGYKKTTCEGLNPACFKIHIGKSLTSNLFQRLIKDSNNKQANFAWYVHVTY